MGPVVQGLPEEGVGDPKHHVRGSCGPSRVLFELGVVNCEEGTEVAAVLERGDQAVEQTSTISIIIIIVENTELTAKRLACLERIV